MPGVAGPPLWHWRPAACSIPRCSITSTDIPISSRSPCSISQPAREEMKISVIVTTYNRPDALSLVLRALAAQDAGDFEVIVADDGSTPETAAMLDALRPAL